MTQATETVASVLRSLAERRVPCPCSHEAPEAMELLADATRPCGDCGVPMTEPGGQRPDPRFEPLRRRHSFSKVGTATLCVRCFWNDETAEHDAPDLCGIDTSLGAIADAIVACGYEVRIRHDEYGYTVTALKPDPTGETAHLGGASAGGHTKEMAAALVLRSIAVEAQDAVV